MSPARDLYTYKFRRIIYVLGDNLFVKLMHLINGSM